LPPGVTVISIHPMYSPGQITAATFLGGPPGGGWLLALNYKRLGEPGKARAAVVITVLAMAALVTIGLITPGRSMSWMGIVPVVVMYSLAKALQGDAYQRHVRVGGSIGSNWRTVGVGLASLAICVATIFGGAMVYAYATPPDEVTVGRSDVRYTSGATRTEAEAVAGELSAQGYLGPEDEFTVQVTRERGRHVVAFVAQDIAFTDDKFQLQFHRYAEPLSTKAFGGAQVDIWLTDDELTPHVKLAWEARPRTIDLGGQHTIAYRQGGQEAEARRVGKFLEEHEYFPDGEPATAVVKRVSLRQIVELFFDDSAFDDPAGLAAGYHDLIESLSKDAFDGRPIDLWLTDSTGTTRVKLSWEARPRKIDLGDQHTIEYQQGGQEAEAQSVGKVLQEHAYFSEGEPASVVVKRVGPQPVVELFFSDSALEDTAGLSNQYRALIKPLSKEAFGDRPIELWLSDSKSNTRVKLLSSNAPSK
jgi:diaminopimelate epimerase